MAYSIMDEMKKSVFTNYQFLVYVKNSKLRFSKVSNIEQEIEMEEFAVGGLNGAPHIAVAPSKKSGRLVLEQGVVILDKDVKGWRAGYYLNGPIDIFVSGNSMKRLLPKHYSISGGLIVKWELSSLDAMGSEVLVQKFEIAHDGLVIG